LFYAGLHFWERRDIIIVLTIPEVPMTDQTRNKLLILLLVVSAVLALVGAGLVTYVRLKG